MCRPVSRCRSCVPAYDHDIHQRHIADRYAIIGHVFCAPLLIGQTVGLNPFHCVPFRTTYGFFFKHLTNCRVTDADPAQVCGGDHLVVGRELTVRNQFNQRHLGSSGDDLIELVAAGLLLAISSWNSRDPRPQTAKNFEAESEFLVKAVQFYGGFRWRGRGGERLIRSCDFPSAICFKNFQKLDALPHRADALDERVHFSLFRRGPIELPF